MAQSGLRRFFYKRILPGDVAKLRAQSNTQAIKTGGGARDLRFSPWRDWERFVGRMFPKTSTQRGKTVYSNELYWTDPASGDELHTTVNFWPPTNSRPTEGRIAQVNALPPYAPDAMPKQAGAEVVFFMCEASDGRLFGQWTTDVDLKTPGLWHPDVSIPIIKQLNAASATANVRGWVDLSNGLEKHFGA